MGDRSRAASRLVLSLKQYPFGSTNQEKMRFLGWPIRRSFPFLLHAPHRELSKNRFQLLFASAWLGALVTTALPPGEKLLVRMSSPLLTLLKVTLTRLQNRSQLALWYLSFKMNKYVNKKNYYPTGGCRAGRIAYFLVICIFPETPIKNFRFLNTILKDCQFSKKKCILVEGVLKRKHVGILSSWFFFFFNSEFLLKYNIYTEKWTNYKCTAQKFFTKWIHPSSQHLSQ